MQAKSADNSKMDLDKQSLTSRQSFRLRRVIKIYYLNQIKYKRFDQIKCEPDSLIVLSTRHPDRGEAG